MPVDDARVQCQRCLALAPTVAAARAAGWDRASENGDAEWLCSDCVAKARPTAQLGTAAKERADAARQRAQAARELAAEALEEAAQAPNEAARRIHERESEVHQRAAELHDAAADLQAETAQRQHQPPD
jgi:hypothetical protein